MLLNAYQQAAIINELCEPVRLSDAFLSEKMKEMVGGW